MSKQIEEFKDRLAKAIQMREIKQIDLAEKTGLSRAAISQYLSGYTMPKTDRIHKLAVALNVSEAWIMGFDAPMERADTLKEEFEKSYEKTVAIQKILANEKALTLASAYLMLNEEQQNLVFNLVLSLLPIDSSIPTLKQE